MDDSAIIRKFLCDTMAGRPDIETFTAPNGVIALDKFPRIHPDLVILDVEMPGLGGLETLERLLKFDPHLRVIMFSSLTESGAKVSMEALALGATDCLAKPTSNGSAIVGMDFLKQELLPRVLGLLGLADKGMESLSSPLASASHPPGQIFSKNKSIPGKFDILAIASSTGGPNALSALFEALSGTLPVPIVGVQHMPPMFTKLLVERLSTKYEGSVHEGKSGECLLPGHFYLAPGDFHMQLVKEGENIVTALHQGPPENSCRPAADVLFRSVVKLFGNRALFLVLTGMGQDGLLGCKELKKVGGYLLAQDEASSVVWGMPGAVTRAGLVDEVLPLSGIAFRIQQLLTRRK